MSARVVGIYALCDLAPERDDNVIREHRMDFTVREFARLSEGPPVLLRELGWSSVPSTGGQATLAHFLTEERIIGAVRTVVLPDDAEAAHGGRHWHETAATLAAEGVAASAGELRDLPYEIILAPGLRARLSAPEAG